MGALLRAWDVLTRRIDTMLFACAAAIVGVGLVTLFSAADQSIARRRGYRFLANGDAATKT